MLKYLNLAVLLPSAKCYPDFIGSAWEIVWGLATSWFYTHSIVHEIQKERKVVFFPALTLWKASGRFFWKWDFFHLLWVVFSTRLGFWQWCVHWSVSAPNSTSHFLPQGCFPGTIRSPILGWCSGERSAKKISKRARVFASCFNWCAFWVPWKVTFVQKDDLRCQVRFWCGNLHMPELETPL